MVSSCSAYNCKNRCGKLRKDGKKLQFHQFPLHNPDLLKKWIKAVKRKDWKPTRASLLCGDHFLEADYKTSACIFLKTNTVPSVFDFSSPLRKNCNEKKNCILPKQNPSPKSNQLKCLDFKPLLPNLYNLTTAPPDDKSTPHLKIHTLPEQNPSPIPNQLEYQDVKPQFSTLQASVVRKNIAVPDPDDKLTSCVKNHAIPEQRPLSISNQLKCPDEATILVSSPQCSTQTLGAGNKTDLSDAGLTPCNRTKMLQKKVKVLQDRLRRRDKKIAKLESMLLMAQKCCNNSKDTTRMLNDAYGDFPCEILTNILSNKSKRPGGQRYSKSVMEFAATLYYNSPSIYKFLRSKLSLPSPSYIRSKDIVASSEEDSESCLPITIPIKKE